MSPLAELVVVALGLTLLGAYGLMSYVVKRRTREMGIRLVVGAQRRDVAKLVLGNGAWPGLAGIALGLPPAVGGTFLLRHLVFRDQPV